MGVAAPAEALCVSCQSAAGQQLHMKKYIAALSVREGDKARGGFAAN